MPNRDSKMRRFCNYFLTLFNQKKLNPFTQFVNSVTLKIVKHNVREKMQYFTKGIQEETAGEGEGKEKKKKKKKEQGPQKLPAAIQPNNMEQHDLAKKKTQMETQKTEKSRNDKYPNGMVG